MSWIQNFFQKLKKDEEGEFDKHPVHNNKPEVPTFLSQSESTKDLDARVSYQYPKNTLKTSLELKKPVEEKRPKKRKEREAANRQTQVQSQVELSPIAPSKMKTEPLKIKTEPTKRARGPFHPTEIPSPVFGFNRPRKTGAVVEHELSHFFKEENTSQSTPLPTEENPTIPISNFVTKILETEDELKETVTLEEIPLVDNTYSDEMDNSPVLNEEFQAQAGEDGELPLQIEENQIEESELPPLLIEENLIEESELAPLRIEEDQFEESEPPKPKRSHLPFNVMMLKQDREKWEVKKRRLDEERQKQALIAASQQEQVVENNSLLKVNEEPQQQESINTQQKEIIVETNSRREEHNDHHIQEIAAAGEYQFPMADLLNPPVSEIIDTKWMLYQEELLNQTLQNFNVGANVVNVTQGPSVTRFEVQPEPGVKVNKITNLSDDIKLSLAARDIRIEAPIPGKHTIGIEVPNQQSRPVRISEIIGSGVFSDTASPLTVVLGLDIAGKPIVTDLKKMPHGLIAGATGSGKSVCINSILVSLLYKASPEDVKLMLIDPKMVELAPYNRIPHLVSPVITDVKAATAALKWAVDEMERRYELFAHTGVRDISRFNELAMEHKRYSDKLPYIVIIIDELADLMMMSPADVEEAICRIAQKARACGIHLIIATQRPSVDVITGLIKANVPTRIAFSVSSQVDSRTIIDISGAEKLLGRGDMLFLENGSSKPVRLQGTFVTDEEIDVVVAHVREQREPEYLFVQEELLKKAQITEEEDELFYDACEFIIEQGAASTSSLQRRFKIGYNRAARLMDMLEQQGYISGANGSKPREVLINEADLESIQDASLNM
ncbi:DNA translocase FtsK [Bacillus sp. FJAT-49825]|uniref:DNA translocase FtsK n=2 Tax=Neobacillus rhizophilus TaxID=2833579 RepID=A0A942U5Y5_9BACI|nr:DNA translocase FtsK [Neobacillus rhizophilus]MBS4215335.1 DNA translocase FtsK [Neobacillus rhizophilus]